MFDIFYIGDNQQVKDHLPFAKQVDSASGINSNTKMYWLVEPNIELNDFDVLDYRPSVHDEHYEHVWKWDNTNYGGLRLLPADASDGVKEVNKVVCRKRFDTLNTKTPGKYFDKHPFATHVWCVDKDYRLTDDIDWAPSNFEPDFVHTFHLRGQLEHKYPADEGGIKLYPRKFKDAKIKYHTFLDASAKYPVMYVDDPEDYAQRDVHDADYVWLIDKEYQIQESSIDWVPNPFEDQYIHSFRMPNQLQEKTWSFNHPTSDRRLGGIRLVPKNWKKSFDLIENGIIIHKDCPIDDKTFDVFYIDEEDFNADEYQELAQRSKSEWFWVVDREYDFNGKLLFMPQDHELDYVHVFKIPDMLEDRYPLDVDEPWDNRCGGVRLVNKNFDMTKHKYQEGIVPVKYDIFYTEDPKQYSTFARKSKTKMFWLIDSEYQLDNNFKIVVPKHEQKFILNYQIDQLQHKYPEQEGGIYLIPKNANDPQVKYKGQLEKSSVAKYPVLRVSDIDKLPEIIEDTWVVDEEYQIEELIDWAPSVFEKNNIHTFHVGNQMRHKYPDRMGGARWVPVVWDGNYSIHDETLDIAKQYPIKRVKDVTDLSVVTTDCWLIDDAYQIDNKINWVPSVFEKESIHTFHFKDQLKHKYPNEMGGIRWVPKQWNEEYVIHESLDSEQKSYTVKFVDDPSLPPEVDKPVWLVDKHYRIHDRIDWVPGDFDKDKVHVFHIAEQLTNKYTENMGGAYWWPGNKEYDIKPHEEPLRIPVKQYPVYFVENVNDISEVKEACWLVDQEYELEETINVIPYQNEQEREMTHTYHVRGQLEHKYPEAMGGVRWVPSNDTDVEIKIHDTTAFGNSLKFETFASEEEGRANSQTGWFWVIDKDVDVLEDFDFNFVPTVWDKGKKHVWQKLNPLTGRQYDYAGVALCPKVPNAKGRPKFIREPACTQREYPVYTLTASDYTGRLDTAYRRLCAVTGTDMFWVVDLHTQVAPDFKFDYYPTQYDKDYLHVFLNEDGEHKNIRLVPKNLFDEWEYTDDQILNNSLGNLKLMTVEASLRPKWPIIRLDSYNKADFLDELESYRDGYETGEPVPFVWSVDPHTDIDVQATPTKLGFSPKVADINKIHCWQKVNDLTAQTHGYGGLRLWPTNGDYSKLTTEDLKLNKIKNVHYIREQGSITEMFDIIFISYHEPNAPERFEKLQQRVSELATISKRKPRIHWVRDVEGIFNAHQAASNFALSKMFWVVDGDADIVDSFDFSYLPDVYDEEVVHVWNSINRVNGLEYGYGGVKLFPTQMVRDATTWGLDFTTGLSSRFKAIPDNSCYTTFNTDPHSAWRSAFRECVKLSINDDQDSNERLEAWLSPIEEAPFSSDAKLGAEQAIVFAKEHKDNTEELLKINDFSWLLKYYEQNNT
jgi:hypothetical protein|tara:strand:+ start:210 stop:4394 length:4185 start_codon:yes stop_codon:yes gene_type:complete